MSAGMTKIASGVDGVGMIVAVGWGVWDGTTVGGAISVVDPPQALKIAIISIVRRKYFIRTGFAPYWV
jgi:hypothetical protein